MLNNDRRSRIVFLLPTFDIGGAERVALRTAAGLSRTRFNPTVVGIARGSGKLAQELDVAGVPNTVIDNGCRPKARQLYTLMCWMRRHRPRVLLTYMFHANMAGRLCRQMGIVSTLICSERTEAGWQTHLRTLLNRHTATWSDGFTVNSKTSKESWSSALSISPNDITVINNGVDTSTYTMGPSVPDVVIGVLARLQRYNGQDWFLDSLSKLDSLTNQPWICCFAGDGPDSQYLRSKVVELGLQQRIRFLGHVDDPPAFLHSLKIAVHPARYSGMPNAVLEAMACGLPVVATAVGGTPEAIENGRTGWLVQPDTPAETAALLADLLTQSNKLRSVGESARSYVMNQFSLGKMVSSTEELIAELTDSPETDS